MDYTQSNSFTTHVATGRRMHDIDKPIPTAVSDSDLNSVIWSLMEVVTAGGQAPASFDPDVPATYQKLKAALDATYAKASDGVHVGQVSYFRRTTAPSGYLKANGAAVSRTTYARLFAEIGTSEGPGDGSTTFNLPDMRGEFIRGWDDGRGVDAGRVLGSFQDGQMPAHSHDVSTEAGTNDGVNIAQTDRGLYNYNKPRPTSTVGGTSNDSENRPRNKAWLACIKY